MHALPWILVSNKNTNNIQYLELISADNENKLKINLLKEFAENDEKVEAKYRVEFILRVGLPVTTKVLIDSF